MFKRTLCLASLFFLASCSSGNDSSAPPLQPIIFSQFSANTRGEFISECLHNESIYYRERLIIKDEKRGSITTEPMSAPACSAPAEEKSKTKMFSYKINRVEGETTYLELLFRGQKEKIVSVVMMENGSLQMTSVERTIHYQRISTQVESAPPERRLPAGEFDQLASGTWVDRQCSMGAEDNTSVRQLIHFFGEGKASMINNIFSGLDCSGEAQPPQITELTYAIDHFENGDGQITVNGEPMNVTIVGSEMTWSSSSVTVIFDRMN